MGLYIKIIPRPLEALRKGRAGSTRIYIRMVYLNPLRWELRCGFRVRYGHYGVHRPAYSEAYFDLGILHVGERLGCKLEA